jgi:hypothetical protein
MYPRRPSFATGIALIALFFALGGTAIAARHYLITSTSQIKPSVLQRLHGNAGAEGARGPAGVAGQQGPAGLQGPAGPTSLGAIIEVAGPKNVVPAKKVASSIAMCPAGTHVVGGGDSMFAGEVEGFDSEAERPQSWFVIVANGSEFSEGWVQAIAYCAGVGQAVSAAAPRRSHPRAAREVEVLTAQLARDPRPAKG